MAERRRLDPRSLDRLEDALASLRHDSDLDALLSDPGLLEASPSAVEDAAGSRVPPTDEAGIDEAGVREALSDAQVVLQLAQQAWPTVEPSDAVIAAILAEAESAARIPAMPDAAPDRPRVHWVWRWLMPSVALAGSAALVLLLVQPDEDRVAGRSSAEEIAAAEAKLVAPDGAAKGDAAAATTDDAARRAATLEESEPSPEPAAATPPAYPGDAAGALGGLEDAKDEGATRPATATGGAPSGKASGEASGEASGKGGGSAGAAMPKPMPSKKESNKAAASDDAFAESEATKDGTWSRLEDAHRKRRKGDCTGATRDYEAVLASKPDPVARAQALAGLGLCLESEGDFSGASDRFDQARDSYVGADTWLDGERATAPSPSEAKKRAKSKSTGSKDPKADSLP
jgi:hypothetical protein